MRLLYHDLNYSMKKWLTRNQRKTTNRSMTIKLNFGCAHRIEDLPHNRGFVMAGETEIK